MMDSLESFEVSLKRSSKKEDREEERMLCELESAMESLENEISEHRRHRIDVSEASLAWSDAAIADMRRECADKLLLETDRVNVRVDAAKANLAALSAWFEETHQSLSKDRDDETATRLTEFMDQLDAEGSSRLEREAELERSVAEAESKIALRLAKNRRHREGAYVSLNNQFENHVESEERESEARNSYLGSEIPRIMNAIAAEAASRKREDDELAEAMRIYVDKLKQSLRSVLIAT